MEITLKTGSFADAVARAAACAPGRAISISGLFGPAGAFFAVELLRRSGRIVFAVHASEEGAEEFSADAAFFLGQNRPVLFPSTELLPFDPSQAHPEIRARRIETLERLLGAHPSLAAASVQTLMQRVMPRSALAGRAISVEKGGRYDMEELIAALAGLGYGRMSFVEERGEMAVRGHILDLYPPSSKDPLRIEFFGDDVESIRSFDIATQRSLKELDSIRVLPAGEALPSEERQEARARLIERAESLGLERAAWEPFSTRLRDSTSAAGEALLPFLYQKCDAVLDYLGGDAVILVIDPPAVRAAAREFDAAVKDAAARLAQEKKTPFVEPAELYLDAEEIGRLIEEQRPIIRLLPAGSSDGGGAGGGDTLEVESHSNVDLRQELAYAKKGKEASGRLLKPLAERVNAWRDEGYAVVVTAHNRGQAERTRELLEAYSLAPGAVASTDVAVAARPGLYISVGSLSSGFRIPSASLALVAEEEVYGVKKAARRPPPAAGLDAFHLELKDLSEGDAVVHRDHGIGLFRGLKRLSVDKIESEYLIIEYRDSDKLYLPVLRLDLVNKYHALEGSRPQLDKLGGSSWGAAKGKVKRAVDEMAGELLKLYATRGASGGFAFSPPDRLFREFEAAFEFDETPDQAKAIEECLRDMQSERPMDRLVCGDVGYGKTEVAIRAAFKAVLDGKQVAVLVPTTVLAQQHYLTFSRRLASFPAVVDVLSRFKTKKEQAETLKKLRDGSVDILIGTHRLLQSDVAFKDLGLVVVDEEHRFGVRQKERLKRFRKSVDVLAMTATPIPRTLHMSLASVRDLSVINTPPDDRLAIKTTVISFDERALSEAMDREMKRGGQVFFVHNRIETIYRVAETLGRMVPHARVAVAHGRMNEAELEKKMLGFIGAEYDVLLSTSIIESGLDIPSANTIIIDRADMFGLAELYQLRGRVGRSRHRAYAYFVCPELFPTEEAKKRIEVIRELTEPGSGFKVATYDLEIRGAGELLGAAQSGHIASVGFDMYAELLEEAVREAKGEPASEEVDPEINLRVSQYIPEEYVPEARERLNFYKRLSSVGSREEIDAITEELDDRFGLVPPLVESLLRTAELRLMLKELKARELVQKGNRLYVDFSTGAAAEEVGRRAVEMAKRDPKRYKLTPEGRFSAVVDAEADPIASAKSVLKELSGGCYI